VPRVSIVISTYNRAELLPCAIQSVQAQTCGDVEIIVADDGSTDNTPDVAAQFGRAIVYLPLQHRGLPATTRNAGLRAATGEFVAFLDSDDMFFADKIALQLGAFEAHPVAGVVYSDGIFFRDTPEEPIGRVQDGLPTPKGDVFGDLLRGNFLAPPIVLIRRACLDAVGFFDERLDFFAVEDYDLWLRLAANCQFVYAAGQVAAIRRHTGSISREIAPLRRRVLNVLAKMEMLYPDLMRQHNQARHEGYARNYGAIAVAGFEQGHLLLAFANAIFALAHLLRLPMFGLREFTAWWHRRHLRHGARR
jgi:glycosyltransferase involved in cell wall biosynthesis